MFLFIRIHLLSPKKLMKHSILCTLLYTLSLYKKELGKKYFHQINEMHTIQVSSCQKEKGNSFLSTL